MIHFDYNEKKAVQALGVLLKSCHSMDYYILTKIIYIAERESFRKWGRPIIGGVLASMEYGPAHGSLLNSFKITDFSTKYWLDNIEKNYNTVILKNDLISDDELSEREINLLNYLFNEFKDYSFDDMKNYTHDFPEYKNVGKTSESIEIETLLIKGFNRTPEAIESISDKADMLKYTHELQAMSSIPAFEDYHIA